jgi:RimJ/RimL family protein N-acetyltransferase
MYDARSVFMSSAVISSDRLDLVSMTPQFLEASLAGDREKASNILGLAVPAEWFEETWLMQLRLDDLRSDAELQPWLLRAVGLRASGTMIGHIGFHTAPGPDYLRDLAPGGVEMGYTIFPAYRKRGYAREACAAMMDWAQHVHGVQRFVLSISPGNTPSLRIAQHFGFQQIGSHVDEKDGEEIIFERRVSDM